jgi:hypothetical protein
MAPATPPSHPPFPESLPRLPIATRFPSSLPSEPRLSPCDTGAVGPLAVGTAEEAAGVDLRGAAPPWPRWRTPASLATRSTVAVAGSGRVSRARELLLRLGRQIDGEVEDLLDGGELEAEPRRRGAPPPAPGCAGVDLRRVGQCLRPRPAWSSFPCWFWPRRRGSAASSRRRNGCEPPREPTAARTASRMGGWMRATAGNARLPTCG